MLLGNLVIINFICLITCSYGQYTPDWDSLDARPLPDWYDEDKIGIFMHFGPFSVPGVRSEWFWMNWKDNKTEVAEFMKQNYPPNFEYQNFGAQLTMEFFNATKFADIVTNSGAKYLVFTSKHHDGYTNFNSSYTFGWNSMSVGPKRNVMKELKDAFSATDPDFHFGIYYSLFEWFNPLYLKDERNGFQTREFVNNKILPEMKELAKLVEPHVWWSDGDWETTPDYWKSTEFLAWLFNESPAKDFVVTNDRWGQGTGRKHGSFFSGPDRWQPGHLVDHKWENAMTIDQKSWGIRRNMELTDVLSPEDIISEIVITVSCGGNILINVGPTKEGTIVPIFEERLKQMGDWLKSNGEAIYGTKPWKYQNDSMAKNPDVWYTAKNEIVYAIMLGWPEQETIILGDVATEPGSVIQMVGLDQNLSFVQDDHHLIIYLPSFLKVHKICPSCQWASVLKLSNVKPTKFTYQDERRIKIEIS